MKTFVSDISGQEFPMADCVYAKMIRKAIFDCIKGEYPDFNLDSVLSISELNYFREKYISTFLLKETRELNELEKTVIKSLKDKQSVLTQLEDETADYTFGQKIADKVAEFGGSWTFIISFVIFLALWILVNVFVLLNKGFDPYPFILLNLILSCIAALQAPVIMMSQNRQEEKDRKRSKNDYMVNLKSELEIRMLHEKIDHLIMHQEQSLIELQKVQIDMMNDIISKIEKKG
ncbi:DUF1003 domain-containing protein [Flavobacterium suncheonense]|uniref:Cyclic nucleotide-binding protein n=1 Tax=Flavobacterium suncheonense GH29-5 = DSM 17707 TaxID=1121899 RepID=A0A0A2ME60_9FLAO|nr:DUF1003 domain-containing protein [Flavobacterium suncheonense]KGO89906.1 hypothetical protein Q764_04660 [Flavobacterium suncheonense GH29-5 = DSM 17707]